MFMNRIDDRKTSDVHRERICTSLQLDKSRLDVVIRRCSVTTSECHVIYRIYYRDASLNAKTRNGENEGKKGEEKYERGDERKGRSRSLIWPPPSLYSGRRSE